jgi:putative PEP-CTERM system histidine kinase
MNATTLFIYTVALFSEAVAILVILRERRSLVHWAFVLGMSLLALESVFIGLAWNAATVTEITGWQHWKLWTSSLLPGVWLFFAMSYGRGNYREFWNRWRFLLFVSVVVPVVLVWFGDRELIVSAKPIVSGRWELGLGVTSFYFFLFFVTSLVLVGINLEKTFRAAVGVMRWRIKFMILGLGVLFAVRFCTSSQVLLSHTIDVRLQLVDVGALMVSCLLMLRSLFRIGHFDLDVYPSHALLQSSLTILLAGIYLFAIGVFAKIVSLFRFGDNELMRVLVFLVAIAFLAVLLLSDRFRLRVNRFVSRHFQRPLYDYRTVWRRFTEATASCVKQADFCQAAVKSATDIFQVLSVTVWLVDDKKEQFVFGASTFLSEATADGLRPKKEEVAEVLAAFQNHHEPVDIDAAKESWALTLQLCHPEEFRKGGNRVCVPMIVGDEILGFMILGDRVSGIAFSWQDFDLLKCIADQIAAGLLNVRLSQKLLQAKELEAFQTMSAFFVHDLKNTANTLNLMLQNLPVHFDDPAFRADALRGVGKTVAHINRLIGRLGSIRHELQIKPVESDLNELVAKALAGWEDVAGVKLVKELPPLPKIYLDQEQILKVVTNLIFNAKEAVTKSGEVQIKTSQKNGWLILAVTDTGCGMSPEFLSRSLFRPFQTTKKTGLGIGMFQSKMIVEAHRGKIEVESEPGKGSVFRVLLPLQKQTE